MIFLKTSIAGLFTIVMVIVNFPEISHDLSTSQLRGIISCVAPKCL